MVTGKFTENTVLKRPKGLWVSWQPTQRIWPGEPLQYKNPVIREYSIVEQERQSPAEQAACEEQEKCDLPISNQAVE